MFKGLVVQGGVLEFAPLSKDWQIHTASIMCVMAISTWAHVSTVLAMHVWHHLLSKEVSMCHSLHKN